MADIKPEQTPLRKALKIFRIVSAVVFLFVLLFAIRKPVGQPAPLDRTQAKMDAAEFAAKLNQLSTSSLAGDALSEIHLSSAEVNAAFALSMDAQRAPAQHSRWGTRGQSGPQAQSSPSSDPQPEPAGQSAPSAPPAQPSDSAEKVPLKDMQVEFVGDQAVGHFVANVYGKDVYLTVSGRLGSRDGYITFDPTGFKVGDLTVPVSMVNPALQRRLAEPEMHERLQLPPFIESLQIANGELVITRKQ
jgi:hypothetical protein